MALPALITVVGTIVDSNGPVAGRLVWSRSVSLFPASTADDNLAIPEEVETVVGVDGVLSQVLYSNNDPNASPTGWTWEVRPHFPHWKTPFSITIPYDSPGAEANFNQLAPVPSDEEGDLYALANHTHAGGGSGADPSGTVVSETAYGAAANAGDSDLYSRGNHTHGSVSLPTPAAIGAVPTADLTAHAADTTAVHGIVDTSALVLTNDGRLSDARTPTAHAASHANDGSDEVSIDGSQIASGTVPIARVPTGTSGTTVSLGNHTHAGGGGTTITMARAIVSSGNITPQNTGAAWQPLTGGPTLVIPAVEGDYISVDIGSLLITKVATTFYDFAVLNGASLVRFGSSGTGTPATEGDGSLYHDTNFPRVGTIFEFEAEAGDINGGNVTICIAVNSVSAAGTFHAGFYPFRWRVLNYGAL